MGISFVEGIEGGVTRKGDDITEIVVTRMRRRKEGSWREERGERRRWMDRKIRRELSVTREGHPKWI